MGTTLVELMVAVALISVIAISLVGTFASISKGVQVSKARTLAANLAQEQIQILKQKSFHRILITTATLYSGDIPYDPGYYPPETITEGSIRFIRYTHVQLINEAGGVLSPVGGTADTGMKAITVSVTWQQGTDTKQTQVRNIVSNVDTTMANAIFYGQVTRDGVGTAISGARVTVAENVGYSDTTDAGGNYSINLSPGSYLMNATADGYFPKYTYASVTPNTSSPQSFALTPMSSGTVTGSVWINDHLVISQVVGSTANTAGFCQEYVEVFNPTTFTWTMNGAVVLAHARYGDTGPTVITMDYNTNTVAAGSYYLYANTSPVTAGGVTRTADAVFQPTNSFFPDIIRIAGADPCGSGSGNADVVGILQASDLNDIDVIGWRALGNNPPGREGTALNHPSGMLDQEQFVRRTSTDTTILSGVGPAYDTDNNAIDFMWNPTISVRPHNTSDTGTIIAGTPAVGAYVTATDGLSQVGTAYLTGSPPYAEFTLTSVATGTWTVLVSSSNFLLNIATVVVAANTVTYAPNDVTISSWPYGGYATAVLNEQASGGYVSGWVKDGYGMAISPAITLQASAYTTTANTSNGVYLLSVPAGTYDITANPNNSVSNYVYMTSNSVSVSLGQITSDVNFTLTQGGRLRGFITRDGTNALTGIAVVAMDDDDVARDEDVSNSSGYFMLVNLSTGNYSVEPIIGSGETSSPAAIVSTVTAGVTTFVGTFTVTGTFGTIRGNVTSTSNPIRSGVLIVCSTSSITTPPSLNSTTLTGAGYYTTNSYEDGTYTLDVHGSTTSTYNLYAYYTLFNGNYATVSTRTTSGISVLAGQTTSGVDFSW